MRHRASVNKTVFKKAVIIGLLVSFSFISVHFFGIKGAGSEEMKRLTLLECLDIALEQNPLVRSARESLEKSKLQVREAYSSILPRLSTSLGYTHVIDSKYSNPVFMYLTPDKDYNFTIDLSQPIFDQGKFFVLRNQADITIDASVYDLEGVKQEILIGVIGAYIKTLKAEEMITIANESKDRLAEHVRVTQRRFEVGQIAKNEVLRAEMELANAESDLIHAQKGLALSLEYLQQILLMDGEAFRTVPITPIRLEEGETEEMVNRAYQKRSDYLKSLKGKDLAKTGITLAKRDFLPSFSLFSEYKRDGEDFFPKNYDFIVGGRIELPIFEGGIRCVRLRRAYHDFTLSEYQEVALKRKIKAEVVEAMLHIQELQASLKAIDKQIEHAKENLRIVQLRYQEGDATNLDVFDANLLMVKAKTDFASMNYDLIEAQFTLLKSIGDLGVKRIKELVEHTL